MSCYLLEKALYSDTTDAEKVTLMIMADRTSDEGEYLDGTLEEVAEKRGIEPLELKHIWSKFLRRIR